MAAYTGFLLLAFAGCVLAQGGKLFDACSKSDIKCLSKATEDFLEKSSNGLPDFQIKALDPLIIPELDILVDEDSGLAFEFKNIHIAGLKNLQISDFKMDTDKKSVVLKTKAVLHVGGDLRIKFTKKNKEFLGAYTASLTSFGSSEYGYSLVKRDDEEYFEVGPETTTCEIIDEPVVNINEVLQNALDNDSDARAMKPDYETNKVSLRKRTLCKIVEAAYVTVIHNIRAAAKALPKRAFFNDI